MTQKKLNDMGKKFKPVKKAVEQHKDINDVRINVGMPMEFDPRQGEVPKPSGVEFTIPHEDFGLIRHISDVCEEYDMKVNMPAYKQPGFKYNGVTYEKDYEKLIRLVPDHH